MSKMTFNAPPLTAVPRQPRPTVTMTNYFIQADPHNWPAEFLQELEASLVSENADRVVTVAH
jgi:hypothetical protein